MTKKIDLSEEVSMFPEKVHCDDGMGNSDDVDAYEACVTSCYHTKADIFKEAIPIMEDIAWDLLQKNDQARTGGEVDAFLDYCQSLLEEGKSL